MKLNRFILRLFAHCVTRTHVRAVSVPVRRRRAGHIAVPVMFLAACFTSMAGSDRLADKVETVNVWELTREADLVVVADVICVDTNITVASVQLLKGQRDVICVDTNITVASVQLLKGQRDETSITFAAPPRPVEHPREIVCPLARSWNFLAGEKWILFLRKNAESYSFTDGRNEEISQALLPFLKRTDPVIRRTTVFILNYRDYRAAFPHIVCALDDPDPAMRIRV